MRALGFIVLGVIGYVAFMVAISKWVEYSRRRQQVGRGRHYIDPALIEEMAAEERRRRERDQ